MTELSKIQSSHLQRAAFVYLRQSSPSQVEHNRESTARQYALAERAGQLGWPREQVVLIDEDLGLSGSSTDQRSGFARSTREVALTHVGIVLVLEVSRLARNNADWLQGLNEYFPPRFSSEPRKPRTERRFLTPLVFTSSITCDSGSILIRKCMTQPG